MKRAAMTPTGLNFLGWIDHDPEREQEVLRSLGAAKGHDARDELGIGTIRDSFADSFFPGLNTIQTRVRYFLFVQWCCEVAARRSGERAIADALHKTEIALIKSLSPLGDGEGVIGIQGQDDLERMPSEIYWNGLQLLRMRRVGGNRQRWARHLLSEADRSAQAPVNEEGPPTVSTGFDANRPDPPDGFPAVKGLSFNLEEAEAKFLRDRLTTACVDPEARGLEHNLFAKFCGYRHKTHANHAWEHPHVSKLSARTGDLLMLAAAFARVMQGASILYNLCVAELLLKDGGPLSFRDRHRASMQAWIDQLSVADVSLVGAHVDEVHLLAGYTRHRIDTEAIRFVKHWAKLCVSQAASWIIAGRSLAAASTIWRQLRDIRSERPDERVHAPVAARRLASRGGAGVHLLRLIEHCPLPARCDAFQRTGAADGEFSGQFTSVQLAALRRICDRTLIFCQRGAIGPAELMPPAVIEVETMIQEVEARGGGAFHPKVWIVRFVHGLGTRMLRLAVSSRNLTADRSWDLGIAVDGMIGTGSAQRNGLGDLLRETSRICVTPLRPAQERLLARFVRDVERAEWALPPGTQDLAFHALGVEGAGPWRQPESDRLVVLSPFLHKATLRELARSSKRPLTLVSRPDAFDRTWSVSGSSFERAAILIPPTDDELANTGALHAKLYAWEKGRRSHIALGSMNATGPATDGRNVEFMATLDCTRALGKEGLDALLGASGLASVIDDYLDPKEGVEDAPPPFDDRVAKKSLWQARLHLSCESVGDDWRLTLHRARDVPPDLEHDLPNLRFRPATLGRDRAASCLPHILTGPVTYPVLLELADITGFVVFEADGEEGQISFTLNLPVFGVSEDDRREAALRQLLPTESSFLDFVRILLGDFSALGKVQEGASNEGGEFGEPARQGFGRGLLELLIRCAVDDPARLRDVGTTLTSLRKGESKGVVPKAFDDLWRAALDVAGTG